jgi:predicted  nucleic acid-binding Zn-ribbon protein
LTIDDEIATRASGAEKPPVEASPTSGEPSADLRARRSALARRLPLEALEIYEDALRRGLRPAAIATRGRVCWGCFHSLSLAVATALLSEEVFWGCPHCERLLFNPDWKARR